jgi:hypothetical protein
VGVEKLVNWKNKNNKNNNNNTNNNNNNNNNRLRKIIIYTYKHPYKQGKK